MEFSIACPLSCHFDRELLTKHKAESATLQCQGDKDCTCSISAINKEILRLGGFGI